MKRIAEVVLKKYSSEGPLIRAKLKEREERCEACVAAALPERKIKKQKQVRFDCTSLSSKVAEELGSQCTHDNSDSVYEYAYVVSDSARSESPVVTSNRTRRPGLVEVDNPDVDCDEEVVPGGKIIIGSVGGVEAVSAGFVGCVPVDILIDSGAVVSLIDRKVLRRIGRASDSLRPYDENLNGVSGHPLQIRGIADLPLRLGSVEMTRPFVFRAVVDLDSNSVTLKDTGEVFSLGNPRVEEVYSARMSSTVRIGPGGQALVVSEVRGLARDGDSVLVEGAPGLNSTVRLAHTLCTVNQGKLL
eukprot:jgi/Phyca11/101928/e_gw1.6.1010.1